MKILSEHDTHQQALDEESRQINLRKGTLLLNTAQNYENNPVYSFSRLNETQEFWLKALERSGWNENFWD